MYAQSTFPRSPRHNVASAKAFFRKALRFQQPRGTITLDGYAALRRGVRELQQQGQFPTLTMLRSSKYLNNLIEQNQGILENGAPKKVAMDKVVPTRLLST
jgi:transposase-like protein